MQVSVGCDYELVITFHSFSNPGHRLAASERCYDNGNAPCSVPTYFRFCVRPIGSPVDSNTSDTDACNDGVWESGVKNNTDSAVFTNTVFGIPNPVILNGTFWVSNIFLGQKGSQLLLFCQVGRKFKQYKLVKTNY